MAQKTYKDIEAEANRRFGKGASREKFEFRRQQQEAAGLEKESKKRGGVAGAYDRNKALVQAAVPALASMFIPGSAALIGGITGGLARGLDRPGKGGIGLDLGQAAQGALTGAAMGGLGRAAGTRLGVGAGAAERAAQAQQAIQGTEAYLKANAGKPMAAMATGAPAAPIATGGTAPVLIGGTTQIPGRTPTSITPPAVAPTTPGTSTAAPTLMSRILTGAKENAPIIQAGLGAVSDVMGQQAQRATEEARLAQQQQQFEKTFNVSEEERRRQREQANRLAGLFMPRSA